MGDWGGLAGLHNLEIYLPLIGRSLELLPAIQTDADRALISRLAALLPILDRVHKDVLLAQMGVWESQVQPQPSLPPSSQPIKFATR